MKTETPNKPCPECGCDMHRSHPKRSKKTNQILYYRRWQCTSCEHYESNVVKLGWKKGESLTIHEREEMANKKAERFYPKDNMLLKKQMLNLNTKEL